MNFSTKKETIKLSKNHSLSYYTFGSGNTPLLCFHGYGLNGLDFRQYAEALPQYTFYSFNLYFHDAASFFSPAKDYAPRHLGRIMERFFERNGIEAFDLLAFSIGSRFALTLLELFPQRVGRVTLLAPDGLAEKAAYRFSTRTAIGRALFKAACHSPQLLRLPARWLSKANLLPQSVGKLVRNEVATPFLRRRVYNTWILSSKLIINKIQFLTLTKQIPHVPIKVFLAKREEMLSNKKLIKSLPNTCEIQWINCSHFQLPRKVSGLFQTNYEEKNFG